MNTQRKKIVNTKSKVFFIQYIKTKVDGDNER